MKKQLLLMMAMVLMAVNGMAQNWTWAKSYGGNKSDYGHSIVKDKNGNTYIVGSFRSDTLHFDNYSVNVNARLDIYVTKLDANNNVVWAKSFGGQKEDMGYGLAIDTLGNIFIAGSFKSSFINFDSFTIYNSDTSDPSIDGYIAKLNSSGNVLWANSFGGTNTDYCHQITTDKNGNVYLAGFYTSTICQFGSTSIACSGFTDVFIAKYNANGSFSWVKSAGGSANDDAWGITCDNNNDILITGYFESSSISFGSTNLINSSSSSSAQAFYVKYDVSGNIIWAKSINGLGSVNGSQIISDAVGNVYLSGSYSNANIDFGTINLPIVGSTDMFIAKFNSSGNAIWARGISGNLFVGSLIIGLAVDNIGNVYTTPYFTSQSINIGGNTYVNHDTSGSTGDFLVVKYDNNGTIKFATNLGGKGDDGALKIIATNNNTIEIVGHFMSDTLQFGNVNLQSPVSYDIYHAKLDATTGLEELPTSTITLSPNPTTGIITIKGITQPSVAVYNLMGQKVVASQGNNEVSLAQLPAGMYLVQVFNNDMELVKSEKVIKE